MLTRSGLLLLAFLLAVGCAGKVVYRMPDGSTQSCSAVLGYKKQMLRGIVAFPWAWVGVAEDASAKKCQERVTESGGQAVP